MMSSTEGIRRLEAHVAALVAALSDNGEAAAVLSDLALSDSQDSVAFVFSPGGGADKVSISASFAAVGKYPRTTVALSCATDASVTETLALLEDRTDASVPKILEDLCDLYGVETGGLFESLQQGLGGGCGGDASGSDEEGGAGQADVDEEEEEEEEDDDDDDDRDSDGDFMADMAEAEDRSLTIACAQRQGRWERHETAQQQKDEEELDRETAGRRRGGTGSSPQPPSAGPGALSMEQGRAKRQQIFAPWEAFRMLQKELLDLLRKAAVAEHEHGSRGPKVSADSSGDDVYVWDVSLAGFSPESRLGRDLAQLGERHGYCGVELRVTFMRGLHPFYPPKVEVLRPRMPLPLCCAVASHPLLSLEYWDPWKPCADLLCDLRDFLELHGEVELDSPMNARSDFPLSSYAPLEQQLVALQAVSPEPAQAASSERYASIYRSLEGQVEAARQRALEQQQRSQVKRDVEGVPKRQYWAAGTGYGTSDAGYSEVWDKERTMAGQAARDAELESVLSALAVSLRCHAEAQAKSNTGDAVMPSGSAPASGSAAACSSSSGGGGGDGERTSRSRCDGSQELMVASEPYRALLSMESVWDSVQFSCVLPLLGRELAVTSFSDMSARCGYYSTWLRVLQQVISLGADQGKGLVVPKSLADSLKGLMVQAQNFLKVVQKGKATGRERPEMPPLSGAEAAVEVPAAGKALKDISAPHHSRWSASPRTPVDADATQKDGDAAVEELAELIMAAHLSLVAATVVQLQPDGHAKASEAPPAAPSGGLRRSSRLRGQAAASSNSNGGTLASGSVGGEGSGSGDGQKAAVERYCQELKPHQLECGTFAQEFSRHNYQTMLKAETAGHMHSRIIKMGREIAGLETMLPLHPASSIFVRVDEEMSMLWRVMITGPEDTPYSCGCFVFDVYFPAMYPTVPPKVNLQTTGGGSVRFNPNLYADGKVCLSLLGTWNGHNSESWDPKVSSIIQVLVSIQSLIFVSQPYFNEPGYEKDMVSAEMQNRSERYNHVIREATLRHAVLGHLQKPPPEFAKAIEGHMKLRRAKILSQSEEWIQEAEAQGATQHREVLAALVEKIKPLLEKIGQ